jgi:hypothetical protein
MNHIKLYPGTALPIAASGGSTYPVEAENQLAVSP